MKVTILGSGASSGVPLIGNIWGACDPSDPRNRRKRPSILVEGEGATLLVDTTPDLREQLLSVDFKDLTAVLYTHTHADHTHGIDDLRAVNWIINRPIPIYGDKDCIENIKMKFDYAFVPEDITFQRYTKATLIARALDIYQTYQFGNMNVTSFWQQHGNVPSLGYRFNDFAYSSDVIDLDDRAFETLKGVKVWVVDCIREKPHHTHAHLAKTLEWIDRVKPECAFLTHMDSSLDYKQLSAKLPQHVQPAYDGLELVL